MTMTTPRDASSRIRSATCRSPSLSPDCESEFAEFFDWQKYYGAGDGAVTQDYLTPSLVASPSSSPSSSSSQQSLAAAAFAGDHLSPIITQIPTMLQQLQLGAPQRASSSRLGSPSSLGHGHHHDSPTAYTGSPPGLEDAGSSTSPSENSSFEHQEDHAPTPASSASSTASLKDAQSRDDQWTYQSLTPRVAIASYPRQIQIGPSADSMLAKAHVQAPAQIPAYSTLKRRRPEHDADKRHRALRDAAQTADVRKNGACVPCRVSKTRVSQAHFFLALNYNMPEHPIPLTRRVGAQQPHVACSANYGSAQFYQT